MTNELILAIDQGTTNTKALLFDSTGTSVFSTSSPVQLIQPKPSYVEQDPVALWDSVCTTMRACAAYARSAEKAIACISISNQRETSVAWRQNKTSNALAGAPVANAISWQCRRSASICEKLGDSAEGIQQRTGLPLDPLLSATKWAWLFEQDPSLRVHAATGEVMLGTIDSWLLYNLTDGKCHATDLTNASRTALLNLQTLDWDDEMLELFGIARVALPALRPSSSNYGVCTAIPELHGIPIYAMVGDSHAALAGHGCYRSGSVKATYGTGSSLMMLTPELVGESQKLARAIAWSLPGHTQFALEGNIAMSGAALQWVGEFLGLERPAEMAARLAETVPNAGGVVFVPAMVGLGAPHWDTAARGLVANLERSHMAAHLARAALDAIAMQVTDVLEVMEVAAGTRLSVLLADGGATRNRTLMQLQADILGREVRRSMQEELSARGAALLGGLQLGLWKNMEDLAALPASVEGFEPNITPEERTALRERWRLAVARARLHNATSITHGKK